jgi:hypothetical protein
MDNKSLTLKDSTMVVQPASSQTSTGTSVATVNVGPNNACFDLAQGAQLGGLGAWSPGAGGWQMDLIVPITSFNASSTLVTNASGGTFTISATTYLETPAPTVAGTYPAINDAPAYNAQTTAGIAYNANASTVALAVNALSNVNGQCTVTGAGSTGSPWIVTFSSSLGAISLSVSATNLTGGGIVQSSPTYTFVVNQSPDGVNWQAASSVKTVGAGAITDYVSPAGGILSLPFQSKWRYIELSWTISGYDPGIVLQDIYASPLVNAIG